MSSLIEQRIMPESSGIYLRHFSVDRSTETPESLLFLWHILRSNNLHLQEFISQFRFFIQSSRTYPIHYLELTSHTSPFLLPFLTTVVGTTIDYPAVL
jgi:hypothetical protein